MNPKAVALMEQILEVFDHSCWQLLKSQESVPMLVTIGAQSSGKSSTLSEIVLMQFPVSDDICTKFVTKLSLRRKAETSVSVNILPSTDRSAKEKEKLRKFTSPTLEPRELKSIIQAVCTRLGANEDDGFCHDSLEIKITAPEVPSITLIDLPGLIDVRISPDQTDEDVQFIQMKANEYINNPRAIVLLIIEGSKDLASNKTLEYLKGDAAKRTIGVLTKPDLMQGTHTVNRYVELLNNRNALYQAGLGWYVLRNRSPDEQNLDKAERDRKESELLAKTAFQSIPANQKGVENLRTGVYAAVTDFYIQHLPLLRRDVQDEVAGIEDNLSRYPQPVLNAANAREKLFSILRDIHAEVQSSFSMPISGIGLAPYHSASWLMDSSHAQQSLQALDSDLQAQLLADTFNPEAMEGVVMSSETTAASRSSTLSNRAEQLVRKYPTPVGTVSWSAAEILLLEQVKPWVGMLSNHVDRICDTIRLRIEEVVQARAPVHVQHALTQVILPSTVQAVRHTLQSRLPVYLLNHSTHTLGSVQFCLSAKESVKSAWRQEIDASFVQAVDIVCAVQPGSDARLAKIDTNSQGTVDIQAIREKLISGMDQNRLAVTSVLMAVNAQHQEILQQLIRETSYPVYGRDLSQCLSELSTAVLATLSDTEILQVFELSPSMKEEVERLQKIKEAGEEADRLLNALIISG